MKKFLAALTVWMLVCSCALAEPLTMGDNLSGVACFPEGSTEADAAYVYRYDYPQVTAASDTEAMINDFYAYLAEDALAFAAPMAAEEMTPDGVQAYTNVTSRVTCNNDAYLSVLVTTESFFGATTSQVYAGHTFARTGEKAGTVVSLPYLMDILDEGETDTWMQDRQTNKANELVWGLVWEIIQQQKADGAVAYDEDLTYEMLIADFYPEEDFYLEEYGDVVFFLQAASVASAAEGILLFPFAMDELKDEL